MRYYILTLSIVGLFVSIHKAFANKFLLKKLNYKVKNINQLNESILEVEMGANLISWFTIVILKKDASKAWCVDSSGNSKEEFLSGGPTQSVNGILSCK